MTVLQVAPMGTQRLASELLGRLVVRSRYDIVDLIGKYGPRSHKHKKNSDRTEGGSQKAMTTITYCKGLPTPADELNPIGFTDLEMFLTSLSDIFYQATVETVNHLLN
ncbi:MAG: hypothetical protein RIE73_04700, partial [Coleofasciculus sp. C1-SOL-03]